MSEDREIALSIALKSLLATTRGLGLDVDRVCLAAISAMRENAEYDPEHVAMAMTEIEEATATVSHLPARD